MQDQPAPDIAVIVPTRNRNRVLPRAIDSVLAQTHENFELIVVDDCSEDETSDYLASVSDPRLTWHRFGEWQGGNAARNFGVQLSRAPILSFLDSDDRYQPDRLANAVNFFRENPDTDICITSYASVVGSKVIPLANADANLPREDFERYLIGYCFFLGGSGLTVRRGAFDEIGGFDTTLARMQDREFLLRAARTRGCAFTSKIDWIKLRSSDSLSSQREGRIAGLGELSRRHPVIREQYTTVFRYLIAREILALALQGKLRLAADAVSEARRNPHVGLTLKDLASDYLRGKRYRQELKRELFRRKAG